MLQTEFIRNLNCNYERILLDSKPEEKKYQYCILNRGGIKYLLPCSLRYINGLAYLYYDISSKQCVTTLFQRRSIKREWLKGFFWNMEKLGLELERFLLDSTNIIWYPEQIFQEIENESFAFLYMPYYQGESSFGNFLEFLVDRIDYEDEGLVDLVYHMADMYEKNGEAYLKSQIFQDAKRLEEAAINVRKMQTGKICEVEEECQSEETRKHEERGEQVRSNRKNGVKKNQSSKNLVYSETWDVDAECEEQDGQDQGRQEEAEKGGFFGLFDKKKKKNAEQREAYRQNMHLAMQGGAVAESFTYETQEAAFENYMSEGYGQTIYMEVNADEEEKQRGLFLPNGTLLRTIEGEELTIGKKREESDVVLENPSVSRIHARISRENGVYFLEDLNSTNGTFQNGVRLNPYERRELAEGDDIRCGKVMFFFR